MKRVLATVLTALFAGSLAGCGEDKSSKPASGGGATTPATVKPPPKGDRPKME